MTGGGVGINPHVDWEVQQLESQTAGIHDAGAPAPESVGYDEYGGIAEKGDEQHEQDMVDVSEQQDDVEQQETGTIVGGPSFYIDTRPARLDAPLILEHTQGQGDDSGDSDSDGWSDEGAREDKTQRCLAAAPWRGASSSSSTQQWRKPVGNPKKMPMTKATMGGKGKSSKGFGVNAKAAQLSSSGLNGNSGF
jgi:hypothetical protein